MTVITRTDRRWFGSALHSGTLNLNVMMRISIGVQRQFVVCSAYAALCGATPMIIGAQAAPLKLGGMVQVGRMHEFTRVSGAAIGPGSLLAISQPRDAQVLLFDLTAGDKPLAVLGRPGEGPGEFSRPGAMGWFNGALWVSDAGRPRVEWFDRRGRLTESAQYPAPPSPSTLYRYVAPMGIQRDSSMLYFPTVNLGSAERMGTDPGTPFPVLRVDGTRVDTIAQLRLLLAQLTLHGDRDGGRAGSYATQPFTHQNFVEVGANGQRVLLVDELTTSGDTMRLGLATLRDVRPLEIRTAACFCRPQGYQPDFHALATDALIVFPWDRKVIEDGELVVHPTYREMVGEGEEF